MLRARSSLSTGTQIRRAPFVKQNITRNVTNFKFTPTISSRKSFHNSSLLLEQENSTQNKIINDNNKNNNSNLQSQTTNNINHQNNTNGPKILASAEAENFKRNQQEQQSRVQIRRKAYLMFLLSFISIATAIYLLYNLEEEEEGEEEYNAPNLLKQNNNNNDNTQSTSLNNVEISGVFQTVLQTLKANIQVKAEQANENDDNSSLREAEESMPGKSVESDDVHELQDSLLESQQEISELRQHVRQLQSQMIEQRKESENELEEKLKEQTQQHLQELDDALEKKEHEYRQAMEDMQSKYERRIEEEVSREVASKEDELMQFFAKKGKERLDKIEELGNIVDTVENAWNSQAEFLEQSHKVHELETAVNRLEAVVRKPSSPFQPQLEALADVAQTDEVVNSVLDSFDDSLPSQGAPSLQELRGQFGGVAHEVKAAAYSPTNTGFLGSIFGKAASYLTVPEKGLVDGDAADSVIARAEFYLEHDNLPQAVREMEQLEGNAANACQPWVDKAKQRLTVEQNVKFLRAHANDMHSSLGQ